MLKILLEFLCKRRDKLHEKQATKIKEALEDGDIPNGRDIN
jgi:hypothetical protein